MPLTVIGIKNAKPRAKPYKLTDSAALYLLVKPNGSKLWRMNYAHLKKHKTLAFGAWPEVSLARAREKRDRARSLIADGIDPGEEARLKRMRAVEQEENTFKSVAEEWFAKNEKEGRAPTTLRKIRWLLDKAYPTLGHRPIAKISAQEILFVLRKVESKGNYESARRMRSVLSRVLRYGIATARANRDVAADLRGALITPQVSHFAAITTSEKAAELLRAIEGYSGHVISCYALKLSPHLFVRPGELRKAEWSEFDFERAIWSIPAKKMKMGRPHKVPLSRQVLKLIGQLRMLSGDSHLLLPSFYKPGRPISENTVNLALRQP
jgi:integrase